VFLQAEQEYSRHNFEYADTTMLFEQFRMAEDACKNISRPDGERAATRRNI
jgi:glycyl-tRNA synthetase alpha subunit